MDELGANKQLFLDEGWQDRLLAVFDRLYANEERVLNLTVPPRMRRIQEELAAYANDSNLFADFYTEFLYEQDRDIFDNSGLVVDRIQKRDARISELVLKVEASPVGYDKAMPTWTPHPCSDVYMSTCTLPRGGEYLVTYKVKGPTLARPMAASVTYSNAQGGTEQADVRVPIGGWERSFTVKEGFFAYLSAQNAQDWGWVTAEIWINGVRWKRSTSSGAYVIATCSGTVGD